MISLWTSAFVGSILFAQPTPEWIRRYNGPANGPDKPIDLALDKTGNVYVTGISRGILTGFDYATVKYDSAGIEQWVRRYNGTGNGDDVCRSIAVDDSDNVYITGAEWDGKTFTDYGTVKYNSQGVEQWVSCYDGPASYYDYANSIILDDSGNVYVTGESADSDTNADFATVKYNSTGKIQWVRRYHGTPGSLDEGLCLAQDGSANIYVAGRSGGADTLYDYLTIKYNSAGDQKWIARYDGPAHGWDHVYAIAVDKNSNVYVTGSSQGINTNLDYATVKYDSAGKEKWVRRYDGTAHGSDIATSLGLDKTGNIYVTGYSEEPDTTYDYATIKYDSAGNEVWVRRFDGPAHGDDLARSIAVDDSARVYVTGSSENSDGGSDYATVKYDSDGNQKWVARYNFTGTGQDGASCLALDNSGNLYVTGSSFGAGTATDYATIKYSRVDEIAEPGHSLIKDHILEAPRPNPASVPVEIRFTATFHGRAAVNIYDVSGKSVRCFNLTIYHSPITSLVWDGTDDTGKSAPAGIYFIRLETDWRSATEKVILVR